MTKEEFEKEWLSLNLFLKDLREHSKDWYLPSEEDNKKRLKIEIQQDDETMWVNILGIRYLTSWIIEDIINLCKQHQRKYSIWPSGLEIHIIC